MDGSTHLLRQVELAADAVGRIEQRHLMPTPRRHRGAGESGGAGADDGDAERRGGLLVVKQEGCKHVTG